MICTAKTIAAVYFLKSNKMNVLREIDMQRIEK